MSVLKLLKLGLLAFLLSIAPFLASESSSALAQGKPAFAGKKAGGGSNRDAARAHALTRGKGNKFGLKRLLGVAIGNGGNNAKKPKKPKKPKKSNN